MKELKVVGVDLAKNVFQIHGTDARGNVLLRKRVNRLGLMQFLANIPPCLVAMEACGGAHYWGREIKKMGHEVRIISPQFVKPYVKSNKNDQSDAEAIVEAALRPGIRFVSLKQEWQQDILVVHRVRERLIRSRTALMNEIRGLLQEYGIVFSKGWSSLRKGIVKILTEHHLRPVVLSVIERLYSELMELEERIEGYERYIKDQYKMDDRCKRLGQVPGVGPITATALVASVGDFRCFKNGRHLAAWLGLVPMQQSSGAKQVLLGISKRGDSYVRKLLIHGCRSVVHYASDKTDRRSRWIKDKVERRGFNKACVALANKNARICWALMVKSVDYTIPVLGC